MLTRSLIVACCLFAGAVVLHSATRTGKVEIVRPLESLSWRIGEWRGRQGAPIDRSSLAQAGVDDFVNRVYSASAESPVALYIGYYGSQHEGDTIHSPLNCLPGAGWEPTSRTRLAITVPRRALPPGSPKVGVSAGSGRGELVEPRQSESQALGLSNVIHVNRLVIAKGMDRELVLYWYQSHGRVTASEYWGRLLLALDAIRSARTDGALVRVITPIDADDGAGGAEAASERSAVSFVQSLFPMLSEVLPK